MITLDRRKAIRNLAIASGGLITLPQWMISCGVSDTATHQTSFSFAEQELLASIADTIIPAGNSIGALSVGVDKFLQKLIDDCYETSAQESIKTQLKALEGFAQSAHKRSFAGCTQPQREELLLKFSVSDNSLEKEFFTTMKSETIRGFNTSQKVMQDYIGYKVHPGHYYGFVEISSPGHA